MQDRTPGAEPAAAFDWEDPFLLDEQLSSDERWSATPRTPMRRKSSPPA